jgi:hypothetical protein
MLGLSAFRYLEVVEALTIDTLGGYEKISWQASRKSSGYSLPIVLIIIVSVLL